MKTAAKNKVPHYIISNGRFPNSKSGMNMIYHIKRTQFR